MRKEAANEIDLSKMTNKELQDFITRQNLEKQYKSLKTEYIVSGRDKVADVLDVAGDVLAVSASAASLALTIYTLAHS